jgi:hypothetical protein
MQSLESSTALGAFFVFGFPSAIETDNFISQKDR